MCQNTQPDINSDVRLQVLDQGASMSTQQKQIRKFDAGFTSMKMLLLICTITVRSKAVVADELQDGAAQLAEKLSTVSRANSDLVADVQIFHKGVVWALRYDAPLAPNDELLVKQALTSGTQRAEALAAGKTSWTKKKGNVLRGFVSAVDGSTQPYGVIIPESYDGSRPMRLDVVLHGSSKPTGMSELRFAARFDPDDKYDTPAPDVDFIELHPLGRVENCYRWAGETDVFEAIEAACRNYNIDRDRIVLRGMSMGASGTWHLGLKHPDRFVAIGPYCGYVDTHRFSETPVPGFIKVGPLPSHQEMGLHMLDSVDYAANAAVVPAIAAIGDQDVFFHAHVIMGEAFAKEKLPFVNLISPGTGHVIDPVTHKEQMRRIGEYAAKGINRTPRYLRFVTWTLKYNRCHWLEVLALKQHYERAEIIASVADDGSIDIEEPTNITQFAIHSPMLKNPNSRLRIGGIDVAIPQHKSAVVIAQKDGEWKGFGSRSDVVSTGKRPGLQGPIDDAFSAPFLCVRGTGTPWNADVNDWASASLRRLEYEWARYMRGELPIKNDTDVSEADVRDKNLILFGDPGSNSWIARSLPQLPVTWTRESVSFHGEKYLAVDHSPVFICASPLAANRYVVINSGHTFHEKEFAAFNYLLFPRLGDWAITKVLPGSELWQPTSPVFPEDVIRAGYFDELWHP
jgi:hypothetical protein